MICTGVITVFAAMIIPDAVRPQYVDNLLGGLTNYLVGPQILRIVFQFFVVIVGVLILSGAVNTSMIGANGVMNRVAEDGVLVDWFRKPHKRYGTTSRIINLIAILQIFTILLSGGDVYLLGDAYAFGVVCGFFLKVAWRAGAPVPSQRSGMQFPFNLRIGGVEIPRWVWAPPPWCWSLDGCGESVSRRKMPIIWRDLHPLVLFRRSLMRFPNTSTVMKDEGRKTSATA